MEICHRTIWLELCLDLNARGTYIGALLQENLVAIRKKKPVVTKKTTAKKSSKPSAKKSAARKGSVKKKTTRPTAKKKTAIRTKRPKPTSTKKRAVSKEVVKRTTQSEAQILAHRIAHLMLEKKAENVVIGDLNGLTSVTDCFVIGTATSDLHARAISDHVIQTLANENQRPHHREGQESFKWILIDYVDVVAHIFQRTARDYYDLERLWGDATFSAVEDGR